MPLDRPTSIINAIVQAVKNPLVIYSAQIFDVIFPRLSPLTNNPRVLAPSGYFKIIFSKISLFLIIDGCEAGEL